MSPRIVGAIVRKDLVAFARDRFFVFMTVLGLVAYVTVFWILPSDVDETVSFGVHRLEEVGPVADLPGLDLVTFGARSELASAVEGGDPLIGISFPEGFADDVAAGREVTVEVIVSAEVPAEFEFLAGDLVQRIAAGLGGGPSAPAIETTVLGVDRVGDQVSFQEEMRPLLAFLVLMVETFALASLVAAEVQGKTVLAVLATPATVVDFLAAKGLLGTMLAFGEAALLVALIGGFAAGAGPMLLVLLLGAVLVTGLGMIAGSFGRDFLSVLFISIAFMIPLMIPAFGVLFPGSSALWVEALPSYGLVDAIVKITVDGAGFGDIGASLGLLVGWCVLLFGTGVYILRRRVVSL